MHRRFADRLAGGRALAQYLTAYADRPDVVVLGLPRGGVPVAFAVAQALHAPLDVYLVRKLGVPGHEELAMGAIASGGVIARNDEVIAGLGIPDRVLLSVVAREEQELARREEAYRGDRPPPMLRERQVILVDDGLATGATMRAAVVAARRQGPAAVIVAVPVAPLQSCEELRAVADAVVCAAMPEPFFAVGLWYEDFTPTSDEEVRRLLARAAAPPAPAPQPG